MLAETVSLTDDQVLVVLLVLLGMLAAAVAVAILGCVFAWKAGRGSQLAIFGWMVVGTLEGLALLLAVPSLLQGGGNLVLAVPLAPLAAQAALFFRGRRRSAAGP